MWHRWIMHGPVRVWYRIMGHELGLHRDRIMIGVGGQFISKWLKQRQSRQLDYMPTRPAFPFGFVVGLLLRGRTRRVFMMLVRLSEV